MQDVELNKFNELKLTWYAKTTKYIAYDFVLENLDFLIEFVNFILVYAKENNCIPDILIHKKLHVRVEIYNKESGGFGENEIQIAKDIETFFIEKYKHE